ncbi:hypothetical protein, partial [Streptococcus infantis]|uniref:hypothetical protein n=1 Tax=Streptococcus infantis TaxID=68892 RepID=UPI0039C21D7C
TITEIKNANNRFCLCGSHDRLCGQKSYQKKKEVQEDFFHTADRRDKKTSQKYCIINTFDTLGQILVNEFAFTFLL